MGKMLNEKVVNGKSDKAARTAQMTMVREAATDFIGDALATEYAIDTHLAEIVSGKTKKKYLFITVDGVQLQVQVTAKEKPVEIDESNLLATYTADTEDESTEETDENGTNEENADESGNEEKEGE